MTAPGQIRTHTLRRKHWWTFIKLIGGLTIAWPQVPALARELVSRRPDVLLAPSLLFVSALKQETTTIPIVMPGISDPLRSGVITSFARPGGNVTGVAWFLLLPKEMELLKEIVPNLRRVAYIVGAPGNTYYPPEAF